MLKQGLVLTFVILASTIVSDSVVAMSSTDAPSWLPSNAKRPFLATAPSPEELQQRRQRIADQLVDECSTWDGAPRLREKRADRNLYYLTGLDSPDAQLVLFIENRNVTSLLFLPRSRSQE